MKPTAFEYFRPATLMEAAERLDAGVDAGAAILAGGQSLVPMLALRVAFATELIDLNAIPDLDRISVANGKLTIPALVRHADFHYPDPSHGPLGRALAHVARHIAHYPIRQRGTFCGSLAHADPASEWCVVSAALGAEIELVSVAGSRRVAAKDWWRGSMETTRAENEIVAAVHLPLMQPDTLWGFCEFSRRAGDLALGMAFVSFRLENGRIADPRIALGGLEAAPRRLTIAEEGLADAEPGDAAFALAGKTVCDAIKPLSDSERYTRTLAATVVRRALGAAAAQAGIVTSEHIQGLS